MHLNTSVRFGETATELRKRTRPVNLRMPNRPCRSASLAFWRTANRREHHLGQIARAGTPSFILQAVSRTGTLVPPIMRSRLHEERTRGSATATRTDLRPYATALRLRTARSDRLRCFGAVAAPAHREFRRQAHGRHALCQRLGSRDGRPAFSLAAGRRARRPRLAPGG